MHYCHCQLIWLRRGHVILDEARQQQETNDLIGAQWVLGPPDLHVFHFVLVCFADVLGCGLHVRYTRCQISPSAFVPVEAITCDYHLRELRANQ